MLTKDDKKYISNEMATQIKNALSKNNDVLVKEMFGLFEATNSVIVKVDDKLSEKIDQTNERINNVLDQLRDNDESINNHEKRIGKLEDKVLVATTSS